MSKKDEMNEVTKCEDGKYRDKDGVEYITIEEGVDELFKDGTEIRSTETISFTLEGITAEIDVITIKQSKLIEKGVEDANMTREGIEMGEFRVDGKVMDKHGEGTYPRPLLHGLIGKVIAAYPGFNKQQS